MYGQGFHLPESVYKVVLQTSIPAQIRQVILYTIGGVDGSVREVPFAKWLYKHFPRDQISTGERVTLLSSECQFIKIAFPQTSYTEGELFVFRRSTAATRFGQTRFS